LENQISVKSLIFILLFISVPVWAASINQGKIINNGAAIYEAADFDSKVLGYAKAGSVFEMSKKPFGPFYKIRLKNKKIAYVADIDISPMNFKPPGKGAHLVDDRKKTRPFASGIFRGVAVNYLQFSEDTMGVNLKDNVLVFGPRFTGPDYLFEGDIMTDLSVLFALSPPGYYAKATGNPAQGWMMLVDYMFMTHWPQSPNFLTFFGFGPSLKYSRFDVTLGSAAKTDYTLEDFSIGAKFALGAGLKISKVALRGEIDYYWEKTKYFGLGSTVQFEF
jgi:hypothetical protein